MSELPRKTVEKPWGRFGISTRFGVDPNTRIGEIWFEPPAQASDLLIKYIFTSEKLSVQVHPDDSQAVARGQASGKEECWYIVDAEEDAVLGIGTLEPLTGEQLRSASLDGSIEHLMDWKAVKPRDFFYIPAGTVHAIGPGVTLVEVQQNADITYRLYDYGRPRELHLDDGVAVAKPRPYSSSLHQRLAEQGEVKLVDGPFFRLWRLDGPPSAAVPDDMGQVFVTPLDGVVTIDGTDVQPGSCGFAEDLSRMDFSASGKALLAASTGK